MNKLQTFFRTLYRSSIDPLYYRDILKTKLSFSLKYFIFLQAVLVFLSASGVAYELGKMNPRGLLDGVQTFFPQAIEVTVKNGSVTLNQPLPYVLALPKELNEQLGEASASLSALIVFDQKEKMKDISNFWEYNALVVVAGDTLYYRKDQDSREIRVNEIPKDFSGTFSTQMVIDFLKKIIEHPFVSMKLHIPAFSLFFFIVVFPFAVFFGLLVSMFYAFISHILLRSVGGNQDVPYMRVFQVTLHALTPVTVLSFVLDAFGFRIIHGIVYLCLYGVWMYVLASRNIFAPSTVQQKRKNRSGK